VARLIDAEIPVMGHIGLTPQSVHAMGGYKVQGKTQAAIEQLLRDARALDRAGAFTIVLEGIPREVAAMITAEVSAATIGIGAGPECDGQILVFHDLVGLSFTPPAKFVRQYADAGQLIRDAVESYRRDVLAGSYPADAESYHLPKDTVAAMDAPNLRKVAKRAN
jgi:3-methyl-2-oxobutanoate hydroxymethyltransferase